MLGSPDPQRRCFFDVPSADELQQGRCDVLDSFALDPAAGSKSCGLSVANQGERGGVEEGGHLPGRLDGQLRPGSSVISLLEPKLAGPAGRWKRGGGRGRQGLQDQLVSRSLAKRPRIFP
jgi:hypothetical protein